MKYVLLVLAAALAVSTQPIRAGDPPLPPVQLPPVHLSQGNNPTVPAAQPIQAENSALPSGGFPSSRYEVLWTKSPFAVATADAAVDASPDYQLVGYANNIEGVSYASVIDRQNQEHFLISSDKPTRGLTLTSITRSPDGSDTLAVVQKDGQPITLKLEQASAMGPGPGPNMPPVNTMPGVTQQIIAPGGPGNASFNSPGMVRPFPSRIHRPLIHLPPAPGHEQQPPPQAAPVPPPR